MSLRVHKSILIPTSFAIMLKGCNLKSRLNAQPIHYDMSVTYAMDTLVWFHVFNVLAMVWIKIDQYPSG